MSADLEALICHESNATAANVTVVPVPVPVTRYFGSTEEFVGKLTTLMTKHSFLPS